METQPENKSNEEYNNIPVWYCKHCGSLRILALDSIEEGLCDVCGSLQVGKASIDAWIDLQLTRYKSVKPIKYSNYGRRRS